MLTSYYFGRVNGNNQYFVDSNNQPFIPYNFVYLQGKFNQFSVEARSVVPGDLPALYRVVDAYAAGDINQQRRGVYFYLIGLTGELVNYNYINSWFAQSIDKLRADNIEIGEQNTNNNGRAAPYQILKASVSWPNNAADPNGITTVETFIFVKKQPRAVKFPDSPEQQALLNVYQGLGLMSFNATNESIDWVGKHRSNSDQAMLENRLLYVPGVQFPVNAQVATTNTVVPFLEWAAVIGNYPAPNYGTDKIRDKPSMVVDYTPNEEEAQALINAGFESVVDESVGQLWPGPEAVPTQENSGYNENLRTAEGGRTLFFRRFDNSAQSIERLNGIPTLTRGQVDADMDGIFARVRLGV